MSMHRASQEPIVVNRDVRAVIVPAGVEVKLRTGSIGYLTQALGGSFTVYVEGNLFRIAGTDGDAIGKEPLRPPELPASATDQDVRRVVWDQLRTCFDPEIPVNIVQKLTRREKRSVAGDGVRSEAFAKPSPARPAPLSDVSSTSYHGI
jgi:hypothetical protein